MPSGAKRYGPDGLQLMLVSLDLPEDRRKALHFLKERDWQGESWILDVENFDAFVAKVSDEWGGPIPTTLVYDRSGELQAVLVGLRPPEEVEGTFLPLLKRQGRADISPQRATELL